MERWNPVAVFVFDPRNVGERRLRSSISNTEVQPFAPDVGGELTVRSLRLRKRHGDFAAAIVARQYHQRRYAEQEAKRRTANQKHPTIHESVILAEQKGQRREAAAADVRFVSERIGWLRFAGPPGSA